MLEFNGPKLTVKLECHAPMLHFQGHLSGVTLRASEVKPKLDRFLIDQVGEQRLENCFLGDKKALNYKLSFLDTSPDFSEINKKSKSLMYYGNSHTTKLVTTSPQLQIICFDQLLQEIILEYLESFFIVTNFGTVQGKGYGSFTVGRPSEAKVIKTLMEVYSLDKIYRMAGFDSSDQALEQIKNFYQLTKSGINFGGRYQRSSLFLYMHKMGIDNEKAEIKQKGLVGRYGTYRADSYQINKNPKFVRAVLGLGGFLLFRDRNKGTEKIGIKSMDRSIERLKSPLFFKLINKTVYIIPLDSYENILDKSFRFSSKSKSLVLRTPSRFALSDFLSFAVSQYNQHRERLFNNSKKIVPVRVRLEEEKS